MAEDEEETLLPQQEPSRLPDRPLECTECRKPIAVKYTEMVGNNIVQTSHCNDCPVLRHKLHGTPHVEHVPGQEEFTAGLACGNCGTTLESIRRGVLLGCDVCYEVFNDILIAEMLDANRIPARIATSKRSSPIHIGRSPGEVQEMNPALRLLALNEALNEMLKSEDYEQAAWLRDQIKALTDQTERSSEKKDEKQQ